MTARSFRIRLHSSGPGQGGDARRAAPRPYRQHWKFSGGSLQGGGSLPLQTAPRLEGRGPTAVSGAEHYPAEAPGQAELMVSCRPAVTFAAPCRARRPVELLKAGCVSLSGEYAAQISTSKHFYHAVAWKYMGKSCQSRRLRIWVSVRRLRAELQSGQGRHKAGCSFEKLPFSIKCGIWAGPAGSPAPRAAYARHLPAARGQAGTSRQPMASRLRV
jgi:hypothetical protein